MKNTPLNKLASRVDMKPMLRAGRSETYIRGLIKDCLNGKLRPVGEEEIKCQGIAQLILSQIHFPKNLFDLIVFFEEKPRNYRSLAVNGFPSYVGSLRVLTNKDAQKFRALINEERKEHLKQEIAEKQKELDSL